LVDGTSITSLSMVDPIFIALPVSILVTFILSFLLKKDVEDKHVEKCFAGI
jgi:hypothetical protein